MEPNVAQLSRVLASVSPALYIFGLTIIVAEALYFWRKVPETDHRSRRLSVKNGILGFGFEYLFHVAVLFAAQSWVYEHRLFDLGFGLPVFVGCFLLNDFIFYVSHRMMHERRLLWAVHLVHHSPRQYDLTTGICGSVLGPLMMFPFHVWIPLLGIHPLVFLICNKVFKFYGLAYHTESVGSLGGVDRILVTPSNHRAHHGKNPRYLDKNYGGFLVLFDRLFGTFEPETEPVEYGLTKDWNGTTVWDAQVHELSDLWADIRATPRWSDRIRYLYKPPGWQPAARPLAPVAALDER